MNLNDNDFILAIKNYEDIVLSIPMLADDATIDELPELYRIFITISSLLRDYDEDLIKLIHNKWNKMDKAYKTKLVALLNNLIITDEKELCMYYSKSKDLDMKKVDLNNIINFNNNNNVTSIEADSPISARSIRG